MSATFLTNNLVSNIYTVKYIYSKLLENIWALNFSTRAAIAFNNVIFLFSFQVLAFLISFLQDVKPNIKVCLVRGGCKEEAKVSDHVDLRITKLHPQKLQSKISPRPNKREMRLIESDWAIRKLERLLGKARALLCQVIFHALLVGSEEMIYCTVSQPEGIAACGSNGTDSQFSGK